MSNFYCIHISTFLLMSTSHGFLLVSIIIAERSGGPAGYVCIYLCTVSGAFLRGRSLRGRQTPQARRDTRRAVRLRVSPRSARRFHCFDANTHPNTHLNPKVGGSSPARAKTTFLFILLLSESPYFSDPENVLFIILNTIFHI